MTLEGKETWWLRLGARVYDSWNLQGDVEELWDELAKLGLGLRCCLVPRLNLVPKEVMWPLERKIRRDRGMRIVHHSTSSSAFNQPSSSHLNDDDDVNSEGTSRASTPSPIHYVYSLTNKVPQVFQNPPNIDPHLEPFYTRQSEIINRQV
nr:hypothetical protein [Tanacetum cinerariifolium]